MKILINIVAKMIDRKREAHTTEKADVLVVYCDKCQFNSTNKINKIIYIKKIN